MFTEKQTPTAKACHTYRCIICLHFPTDRHCIDCYNDWVVIVVLKHLNGLNLYEHIYCWINNSLLQYITLILNTVR